MVESKLRLLVMNMEKLDTIALAHPFNKGFDRVFFCRNEEVAEKIAKGGCLGKNGGCDGVKSMPTDLAKKESIESPPRVDENGEPLPPSIKVWTTIHYVGVEVHPSEFLFFVIICPPPTFLTLIVSRRYNEALGHFLASA